MRGEYCVGGASFLSFVAIFAINLCPCWANQYLTCSTWNCNGKSQHFRVRSGINESILNPIGGLYTTNYTSPLGEHNGLRQFYDFGLYSYCAYVNSSAGTCTNRTVAYNFEPYAAMKSDMLANYSQYSDSMFVNTTFFNSAYLAYNSRVAYYFLLIGTIFATIALFTGVAKRALLFFISTASSIMAALFILIGAAIWTSIVKKSEDINTLEITQINGGVLSGVTVSYGNGIYLAWAAFACLAAATVPYMVSCCTFRG